MTATNPLLAPAALPPFSALAPEHVAPALDSVFDTYRAVVARVCAPGTPATWAAVMQPLEEQGEALSRAFAPVGHVHAVADTPAWRDAHAAAVERIAEFETELSQNRALYEAVQRVRDGVEFAGLSRAQRTVIEHALRDFRLGGVALEEPARTRYKEIATALARLSTEFEQALLDATEAWYEDHGDASALAGLPPSALAILRGNAEVAGVAGYRITLHQPSYLAVMTHARDRALRERVYAAYGTRASDQGPHAGRYDNSERIERILALRHEAAQLLGFANAAEESLATKMAPSTERVLSFLDNLVRLARPAALREREELGAFARAALGIDALQPWDMAYAAEQFRQTRLQLAEEELKPYFTAEHAIDGVLGVAARVFGLGFRPRTDVDVWHPDARYVELLDDRGAVFAGVYLDLYARQGKRGGAWMDVCRTRWRHAGGVELPVAFLTCNFAAPGADQPSLLTHDDVVTLFHEFGHGLHHLLTEVDVPSVSGIAGVEWDAVELPSQFLENFAWSRQVLDLFARHWRTQAPLPDDLFERLSATRHFHAGLHLVRQLEFALFDFRLHREYDPARGARVGGLLERIRDDVAVVRPPAWQRFAHSFGHIFAGGYAAGYYSYLWAEVLSADAFERFVDAGVLDAATGAAFRRSVLAVGGSRPALQSFIEFRGREPDPAALLRSYGLAA
jgi:oligopeptidase A